MFYDLLHSLRIEILTAEYVEIGVSGFVAKVARDVTCFYQLDQCESCFVPVSEMLDKRLAIRHHVDSLHKIYRECVNVFFITN